MGRIARANPEGSFRQDPALPLILHDVQQVLRTRRASVCPFVKRRYKRECDRYIAWFRTFASCRKDRPCHSVKALSSTKPRRYLRTCPNTLLQGSVPGMTRAPLNQQYQTFLSVQTCFLILWKIGFFMLKHLVIAFSSYFITATFLQA